jgi:hypothetical protein
MPRKLSGKAYGEGESQKYLPLIWQVKFTDELLKSSGQEEPKETNLVL